MKWTLLLSVMAAGVFAHGTQKINMEALDFSVVDENPAQLLEFAGPTAHGKFEPPQSCVDTAITDAQDTQIKEAVLSSVKEQIKIKADMKIAKLEYLHDIASDKSVATDAETSGAMLSTSSAKLVSNKVALANTIIYSILKPEQRKNAVKCMLALKIKKAQRKLERICKNFPGEQENNNEPLPDSP